MLQMLLGDVMAGKDQSDFWCSKAEDHLEYNLGLFTHVAVYLGARSFLSSRTCPHILTALF